MGEGFPFAYGTLIAALLGLPFLLAWLGKRHSWAILLLLGYCGGFGWLLWETVEYDNNISKELGIEDVYPLKGEAGKHVVSLRSLGQGGLEGRLVGRTEEAQKALSRHRKDVNALGWELPEEPVACWRLDMGKEGDFTCNLMEEKSALLFLIDSTKLKKFEIEYTVPPEGMTFLEEVDLVVCRDHAGECPFEMAHAVNVLVELVAGFWMTLWLIVAGVILLGRLKKTGGKPGAMIPSGGTYSDSGDEKELGQ